MAPSTAASGRWSRALSKGGAADHGLPWRHGHAALAQRLANLPRDARGVIAQALAALGVDEHGQAAYLSAVLMAIGGWGAWCAYERWQARLAGHDDDQIEQLLAIRVTWEWLLHTDAPAGAVPADWAALWSDADAVVAQREGAPSDWQRLDAPVLAGATRPARCAAWARAVAGRGGWQLHRHPCGVSGFGAPKVLKAYKTGPKKIAPKTAPIPV